MIGDSVLAAISNRYGNQLCTELVPRRWVVEVDAEVGRRIDFGRQVLAKRGDDDWDAAVIMLGNNYDGDADGLRPRARAAARRARADPGRAGRP